MRTRLMSLAMLTLTAGGVLGFGAAHADPPTTGGNDSPFNHGYCVGDQFVETGFHATHSGFALTASSLCDEGNMI